MTLLPFGFIRRIAVCFWCGDSGVVHAGASQPGVDPLCTLLLVAMNSAPPHGPPPISPLLSLRRMLARLLTLLSLRRNADELLMASGTPRESSESISRIRGGTLQRGEGTGGKLHRELLHLAHLLLSLLLHLWHLLLTPLLLKVLMLLVPLLHLRHLLVSAFLLQVLLLLLTMFHLQHLLLSPSNQIQ